MRARRFICATLLISYRVIRVARFYNSYVERDVATAAPSGELPGLIKFTGRPRHGTVSVSLRLRPSRFILVKRQRARVTIRFSHHSPEVGKPRAAPDRRRERGRERESAFCITKPSVFSALRSLLYAPSPSPVSLPEAPRFWMPLCDYWSDETVSVIDRRKIAFFRLVYRSMKRPSPKRTPRFPSAVE